MSDECLPKQFHHPNNRLATSLCSTYWTSKAPGALFHDPPQRHIQHQPTRENPLLIRLSCVRIRPHATIQTKKEILLGAFTRQILFQGRRQQWYLGAPYNKNAHETHHPQLIAISSYHTSPPREFRENKVQKERHGLLTTNHEIIRGTIHSNSYLPHPIDSSILSLLERLCRLYKSKDQDTHPLMKDTTNHARI